MTSPVDTSVKHFFSTMLGAPVLSGTAGSGIAWLDALLVNGFDTKTVSSLTVASGVATVVFTGAHSSIIDSVILVAGVSGGPAGFAGLNGEQKVTARPLPTSLTFATALPDGTYTGTINIKMAPLGWAKVFAGTNEAVYKSTDPMAHGMFLRVIDTAAQSMRVIGYESMSAIDTGTGLFPTTAIFNGGGYWHKSGAASASAVGWAFFGDARTFFHSIRVNSVAGTGFDMGTIRGFGDPIVLRPSGDVFSTFMNASYQASVFDTTGCLGNNVIANTMMPREYVGLGSAIWSGAQHWGGGTLGNVYSGVTPVHGAFPNQRDGAMYLGRKYFATTATAIPRADMPGIAMCLQSGLWDFFRTGDRAPGTGYLTGRNLVAVTCAGSNIAMNNGSTSGNTGIAFVDVTGPWR